MFIRRLTSISAVRRPALACTATRALSSNVASATAAAIKGFDASFQSERSSRAELNDLLTDIKSDKPKNVYPHLSIKEAVLSKYPFRMELQATVPMKVMLNKEYQFPHYKAKLTCAVQDMALTPDVRRVFIELAGHRYKGGKVSFVAREYASVEACEEKVYALLDQCITRATALSGEFHAADVADPALQELRATIGTAAEDAAAADVRGVLLPYRRPQKKIGTKRKGLYLLPTGLSVTPLGVARQTGAAAANETGSVIAPAAASAAANANATPEQLARRTARRAARKAAAAEKQKLFLAAEQAAALAPQPVAASAAARPPRAERRAMREPRDSTDSKRN